MIHKIISLINYYTGKYLTLKKQENKEKIDKQWKNYFLNDNKFIFKLRHNISIYLYNDSVLARLIYEGFEKNEIDYIEKSLNNGDIFVDIGANIGLFSLIASQLVGEKGKVISFEPSPITFNRLQENINLNKFSNIEVVNKGISDNVGKLSINLYEEGFDAWNSFAPPSANFNRPSKKIDVEVNTLDSELKRIDKNKIKIIKIDVEGWEKFVLLGAEDILTNYSPIIMMEFTESNTFSAGYMVQDLYDILVAKGYIWHEIINGELHPSPKKLHYPYNNLIAIKP